MGECSNSTAATHWTAVFVPKPPVSHLCVERVSQSLASFLEVFVSWNRPGPRRGRGCKGVHAAVIHQPCLCCVYFIVLVLYLSLKNSRKTEA